MKFLLISCLSTALSLAVLATEHHESTHHYDDVRAKIVVDVHSCIISQTENEANGLSWAIEAVLISGKWLVNTTVNEWELASPVINNYGRLQISHFGLPSDFRSLFSIRVTFTDKEGKNTYQSLNAPVDTGKFLTVNSGKCHVPQDVGSVRVSTSISFLPPLLEHPEE